MWDLTIVGAGPAGTACALSALSANPRMKVLLLDRHSFPRDKTCGDGLSASACEVIRELEAHDVLIGANVVRNVRADLLSGPSFNVALARPLLVLPRRLLDSRLLSAAIRRGATFRQERVSSLDFRHDCVRVNEEIETKVLVAADGSESFVRKSSPIRDTHRDMAIAVRGYTPTSERSARLVFDGIHWPGYAWSFPGPGGIASIGYGRNIRYGKVSKRALVDSLLQLIPDLGTTDLEVSAARIPLAIRRPRLGTGRVLFAGDAAALANPTSGEGIYAALLSGSVAGVAATSGTSALGVYRNCLRERLGRHMWQAGAVTRIAQLGLGPYMFSRLSGNARMMEDFVGLGLGGGTLHPIQWLR